MQKPQSYALLKLLVAALLTVAACVGVSLLMSATEPLQPKYDLTLFEGEGTTESPFLVQSCDDLVRLRDLVNQGDPAAWCHYRQTADIDLAAEGGDATAPTWEPIGNADLGYCFYGDYDGFGHTIANLNCYGERAGLFNELRGTVRNLGISSGVVSGDTAAAFACHMNPAAVLLNCFNAATVRGAQECAGLAVSNEGKILYCWNVGVVEASEDGLAGGITIYKSGTCKHCVSVGARATERSFTLDEDQAMSLESFEDAARVVARWHEEAANYLVAPTNGSMSAMIGVSGSALCFADPADASSGFVRDLWEGVLLSHAELLALAAVALVVGIVALCLRKRLDSPSAIEKGPVGAVDEAASTTGTGMPRFRQLVGFALFCVLTVGGVIYLNDVFGSKNTDTVNVKRYADQPTGTVDVLNIGSSRAGLNTDLSVVWREYGISSYSLWSAFQSFWNSYYDLSEALRTNRPSVVTIEVHASTYDYDYADYWTQAVNVFGIQDPLLKFTAARTTAPQGNWLSMLLELPVYHTRFAELTREDFDNVPPETYKGTNAIYGYSSITELGLPPEDDPIRRIHPKQEAYLRACIELLQRENVPVILYASPTAGYPWESGDYSAARAIATEYGVDYLDLNDFEGEDAFVPADFCADNVHLNTYGARKVAARLGNYLQEHFDFADHRGDERYASWDTFAERTENAFISKISDVQDYLAELRRDGRTVLLASSWVDPADYMRLEHATALAGLRLPMASGWESREAQLWLLPDTASNVVSRDPVGKDAVKLGTHELVLEHGENGTVSISERDEPIVLLDQPGVVFVVYDSQFDKIVDIARITSLGEDPQLEHIGLGV